jgi:hypothetical protein
VLSAVDSLTVSNNTGVFNATGNNDGIIVLDVNNAQIYGNRIYHATEGIGVKGYTRDVTGAQVHDNAVYDTRGTYGDGEAIEFTGNYRNPWHVSGAIYRNFIQGGPYMINGITGVYTINAQAYNNIVVGPVQDAAFHWSSYCPGTVLYNNTVYNAPFGMMAITGSTATIKNNIFSGVSQAISVDSSGSTEDYNIFFNSVLECTRIVCGSHSIFTNPKFVSLDPSAPSDFELQSGSPAINSGANLGSPFNWALDPLGKAWPYPSADQNKFGSGWERGAFVFRSSKLLRDHGLGTADKNLSW